MPPNPKTLVPEDAAPTPKRDLWDVITEMRAKPGFLDLRLDEVIDDIVKQRHQDPTPQG